jgi:hypothetical protein
MESFLGTLKTELVHHREYPDRNNARRELFAYIEAITLISKAITIVRGSTPPSATSPHSRQRHKPHNPVSTFPGEGHSDLSRLERRVNGASRVAITSTTVS